MTAPILTTEQRRISRLPDSELAIEKAADAMLDSGDLPVLYKIKAEGAKYRVIGAGLDPSSPMTVFADLVSAQNARDIAERVAARGTPTFHEPAPIVCRFCNRTGRPGGEVAGECVDCKNGREHEEPRHDYDGDEPVEARG